MAESGRGAAPDRMPRSIALSDEAIAWLATLRSGRATGEDRRAYGAWRARSPAHEDAARQAEALFGAIGGTSVATDYRTMGMALASPPYRQRARRFGRRAFGAALAGSGVAWLAGPAIVSSVTSLVATYHTGVGERRLVRLDDGSHVWLNTATALSVAFTAERRRVVLHDGEALFDVARDAARPFVVHSGAGEAEALGTRYRVRRDGEVTLVSVVEGRVAVRAGARAQQISAGQEVRYGGGILSAPEAVDAETLTSWTRGKLIFNRQPLAQVAAELERYRHGRVLVRGAALRALKVTGVFDLDDNDALLAALSSSTGVRVIRLPWLLVIH